jgi:hypothetical protein
VHQQQHLISSRSKYGQSAQLLPESSGPSPDMPDGDLELPHYMLPDEHSGPGRICAEHRPPAHGYCPHLHDLVATATLRIRSLLLVQSSIMLDGQAQPIPASMQGHAATGHAVTLLLPVSPSSCPFQLRWVRCTDVLPWRLAPQADTITCRTHVGCTRLCSGVSGVGCSGEPVGPWALFLIQWEALL